ncbi:unnamed protein product [Heterobilharzia americana]|nr:unnamed protein product [Heterobilharzia americana]
MEVDSNVDASNVTSGPGSVSVLLHPLVILNISEHWTRNKVKENSTAVTVYGALLGKQEGHHIEISNSFELLLDDSQTSVNSGFYKTRETQCKQVYPDLDIIGWYTTGGPFNEKDELFNRQMQELNELLLILKLDPLQTCGENLPIRVYQSVVDNDAKVQPRPVSYTLATDEAERIGVDYVARISMSSTGQKSSMTAEHLLGNYQAIQMLNSRLQLIRSYISAVASGELPPNRAMLREINALIKRVPLMPSTESAKGNDHLYRQANDVCLTALLASITQGLHTLYGCMVKTAHAADRRSMPMGIGITGSSRFVKVSHVMNNSN